MAENLASSSLNFFQSTHLFIKLSTAILLRVTSSSNLYGVDGIRCDDGGATGPRSRAFGHDFRSEMGAELCRVLAIGSWRAVLRDDVA